MAEQVQALLDDMVGPMIDLQSRGIFSESEIAQIVARRRDFEYRLRRRQPRQSDYLEYLETEEKLEELRRLRTQRLNERVVGGGGIDPNDRISHTNSKHIGDVHGIRFLHLLWIRTLRKYRTVEMYLQYAKFCERLHSYQRLAACYQDALSFFPHSIDLWIAAASHEFFIQKSMRAARILLQRALRIHPSSTELWIQNFKLELHWRCKLIGRKMILNDDNYNDTLVVDAEKSDDSDPYKMAKIVYEEAIKSKAASPELPWQFVAACQDFPAKDLQQWIVQGLTHASENTWIIHARYLASQQTAIEEDGDDDDNNEEPMAKKHCVENPVIALLKNACQSIPTSTMFVEAISFLDEYMENERVDCEKIQELQNKLFEDATSQGLVNNELLYLQVDHLPPGDAISLLESYTRKNSAEGNLWIKYASLIMQELDENEVAIVLETALTRISINKADYVVVLVQLLGIQLVLKDKDDDTIAKLVQRLLLLAPANPMADCEEPLNEQAPHVPAVLDLYLEYLVKNETAKQPIIFDSILSSKCMDDWVAHAPDSVDALMDKLLKMESCRKRQEIMFERAIRIFKDTPKADTYRVRRDNELRYRVSTTTNKFQVPNFKFESVNGRDIEKAYNLFQVCYVKAVRTAPLPVDWKDVEAIFAALGDEDKASWCVENGGAKSDGDAPSPTDILAATKSNIRSYCSFLIQKDKTSYETSLQSLPFASFEGLSWIYEPALWFFFGRNPVGSLPLEGRPEHTDSVCHDGTWHFQLSGRKNWYLRPTKELLKELAGTLSNEAEIRLECSEGDVLLVNTRLWFHRTEIPPQDSPSVSYARDFRVDPPDGTTGPTSLMTNVSGLYATEDIGAGCVIFTESDMPDCELHQSSNPNCELVELEELGQRQQAIISTRDIKAGEFFCIAECDSEDSEDSDSEESEIEVGEGVCVPCTPRFAKKIMKVD